MNLFFLLPTAGGLRIVLEPDGIDFNRATNVTCYAGTFFGPDGNQYAYSAAGVATGTDFGPYIFNGTTSDVWLRCTVNSGTLDGGSSSTGTWLSGVAEPAWYIVDSSADDGAETASITVEAATDSGGSNIVDSETYTLSASYITL